MKHAAVAVAALAMALTSACAWSHGGRYWDHRGHYHSHDSRLSLGFVFGGPVFGGPLWYPGPVYAYPPAYPPAIVVPPAPRVYIERDDQVARESSPGYWYYCRESNTYYPYVKECAAPWERVPAQPQDR